jgi:hypothetical protein
MSKKHEAVHEEIGNRLIDLEDRVRRLENLSKKKLTYMKTMEQLQEIKSKTWDEKTHKVLQEECDRLWKVIFNDNQ